LDGEGEGDEEDDGDDTTFEREIEGEDVIERLGEAERLA